MKKILYANGDSFVFGMECSLPDIKSEKNKELAFPKYLSDLLGCDTYINEAHNGATNEFIFRKTILDLQKMEKEGVNPADVFVVVGITSLHRTEIDGDNWLESKREGFVNLFATDDAENFVSYPSEYIKYGTLFVQPGLQLDVLVDGVDHSLDKDVKPFLINYIWSEAIQVTSQEARIIALHEYLTVKGYRHLFVNSVCPFEQSTNLDFSCKNYYKLNKDAFWRYAYINFPKEQRKYKHFSTVPHKAYASLLLKYIEDNGL